MPPKKAAKSKPKAPPDSSVNKPTKAKVGDVNSAKNTAGESGASTHPATSTSQDRPTSASGRQLPTPRATPRSKNRETIQVEALQSAESTSEVPETAATVDNQENGKSDEQGTADPTPSDDGHVIPDDPWKDMDFGEQWEKVNDVEELTAITQDDLKKASHNLGQCEGTNGFYNLSEAHVDTLVIDDACRSRLVYMDAVNNDLSSFDWAGRILWLRHLSLNGNQITKLPSDFSFSPMLIRLDLSFNPLESLNDCNMSALTSLRHLLMENCGLSSIENEKGTCPLADVKTLVKLELQENELDELDEFALLSPLVNLIELDASENPATEESKYRTSVTEAMPNLRILDKKATNMKSSVRVDDMGDLRGDLTKKGVLDDNEDKSSCSCLAGNACLSPFCCADWPNRFKVARAVRESRAFSHGNI